MAIDDPLALTEDQRALRDTLHGLLADRLPPAALRAMLETEVGYSPELHARLAGELGLTGLTVPEEFGGRGMSHAEASVVHTELGYALYPGPYLSSALAASAVVAAGDRAAAERWLPLLADGSVTGTVAIADKDGLWSPATGGVRAHLTPMAGGCTAAAGTSSRRTWRASWWCRPWPDPRPRCSWWKPGPRD